MKIIYLVSGIIAGLLLNFSSEAQVQPGIKAGLSSELRSGFVFTTRYYVGLTNVIDDQVDEVNSKNSALQISLAYRFLSE